MEQTFGANLEEGFLFFLEMKCLFNGIEVSVDGCFLLLDFVVWGFQSLCLLCFVVCFADLGVSDFFTVWQ